MRRLRRPANQLRTAIDCLPLHARRAMLDGVEHNRIIVGAYVDRRGGVCPMLAAHRHGGRTSLASFARAWDRYTRAGKGPRPATYRELRTLRSMLETSIALDAEGRSDLARAIVQHEASREHRARSSSRALETPGWAWLRPFRRLDQYQRAVVELDAGQSRGPGERREPQEREALELV